MSASSATTMRTWVRNCASDLMAQKKRDVVVELIIERVLGIDRRGRQALAGLERVASRDVAAAAMDSLLIGNDCVS